MPARRLANAKYMNYSNILEKIQRNLQPHLRAGKVPNYIPELARVPVHSFGMAIATISGNVFSTGAGDTRFSIQSISKLFACTLVFRLLGDALWQRVGREPSGNAFNSLVQLEAENGKPRNRRRHPALCSRGVVAGEHSYHRCAPIDTTFAQALIRSR
jgi:glutaminase